MTDPDLVLKKLAWIEACLHELRSVGPLGDIETDVRTRRFVEHTLQIAIQAAIDAASHVVSDCSLGEPRTQAEHFELLARAGWIGADLALSLKAMTGFRNVLVHGYDDVDLDVVRDVLEHRLIDLETFVGAIRSRV